MSWTWDAGAGCCPLRVGWLAEWAWGWPHSSGLLREEGGGPACKGSDSPAHENPVTEMELIPLSPVRKLRCPPPHSGVYSPPPNPSSLADLTPTAVVRFSQALSRLMGTALAARLSASSSSISCLVIPRALRELSPVGQSQSLSLLQGVS